MTIELLVIGLALIGLEVFTASTFFIFLGLGFLGASFVSLLTDSVIVISLVGIVVSVISLVSLRAIYVQLVLPKEKTQTSYNGLIGKHAIMQDDYTSNGVDVGLARVSGTDWSVQCETNNLTFTKGERVAIKKIEGARLIIDREE